MTPAAMPDFRRTLGPVEPLGVQREGMGTSVRLCCACATLGMANIDGEPPPGCSQLDDDRPSLVVDAATESLEVMLATSAWTTQFGDPPGALAEIVSEELRLLLGGCLAEMVEAAAAGSWSRSRCQRYIGGLCISWSDGAQAKVGLDVAVPHPMHWSGQRPARISILWRRSLHTAPPTLDRSAPASAPASARMPCIPENSEAEFDLRAATPLAAAGAIRIVRLCLRQRRGSILSL